MEILTIVLNSKATTVVLEVIFTLIFGYIAKKIKGFLNTKAKRETAADIVMAVEQIYKNLHGEEKMSEAMKMFAAALGEKGIKISTDEMKYLLESAVGTFNDVFNKDQEIED